MKELLFVGTYTRKEAHVDGKAKGINVFEFDEEGFGQAKHLHTADFSNPNPSFLCLDANANSLYAISETGENDVHGYITSYAIDKTNGTLKPLNKVNCRGRAGCFVKVESQGKYLMAANYFEGNVVVFAINPDGSLSEEPVQEIQHPHEDAKKTNPDRQHQSHAHMIIDLDLEGDDNVTRSFVYVPDLGLDRVYRYEQDKTTGKLTQKGYTTVANPGAGPRHISFHPHKRLAYVINELDSTVDLYAIDRNTGDFTRLQTHSTIPSDFQGESSCADIHVHPSGKFLYGSNRGHDSIVIFKIGDDGKIELVDHEPTRGKIPRNFAIHPKGHLLLAANQNSDTVTLFQIDQETGKLQHKSTLNTETPVCLTIASVEA